MKHLKLKGLDLGNAQPLTKENMRKILGGASSMESCVGAFCKVNSDCVNPCLCNEPLNKCELP